MNEKDQVSMALAVKQMQQNMPALLEYESMQARLLWARFTYLRGQGFSEQQALELCQK